MCSLRQQCRVWVHRLWSYRMEVVWKVTSFAVSKPYLLLAYGHVDSLSVICCIGVARMTENLAITGVCLQSTTPSIQHNCISIFLSQSGIHMATGGGGGSNGLLIQSYFGFLLLLLLLLRRNWFKWRLTIKTVTGALYKVFRPNIHT